MDLAEVAFDVLIALNTNLHYQQNLSGRKIAIIVLKSSSNRLEHLRQHFPSVLSVLEKITPGEIVVVGSLN